LLILDKQLRKLINNGEQVYNSLTIMETSNDRKLRQTETEQNQTRTQMKLTYL